MHRRGWRWRLIPSFKLTHEADAEAELKDTKFLPLVGDTGAEDGGCDAHKAPVRAELEDVEERGG